MEIEFPTYKIDLEKCYDSAIDYEKFTKAFSKYLKRDLRGANIGRLFDTYAIVNIFEKDYTSTSIKVPYKDFPKNSSFKLLCQD